MMGRSSSVLDIYAISFLLVFVKADFHPAV